MDLINQYLPLWMFIILMVSTPGPANMLLMTAGAQQGLARTVPFIAGLTAGKLALNIALGLGLMGLLQANPTIAIIFMYCSATYMAYLALRNWTPPEPGTANASFTFFSGCIVHPLSPKTWMMATLAITQFADSFESVAKRLLVVPLSFLAAQVFFAVAWCGLGVMMSRTFEQSIVMHRALIILTLGIIVWALLQ